MDLTLFNYLNSFAGRFDWLDTFFIFLASYLEYWLVGGLVALAIFYRNQRGFRMLIDSLIAVLFSRFIVTEIIRFFYAKPRPFEVVDVYRLIDHSTGSAFPSGHAAFFFALAMVVFLYDRVWGSVFFAGAVLISISRVVGGIHWPADILGGAVVGILSGILIFYVMKNRRATK
ncbi:MAG: phosphatase PAP2 family protein [Candidatus Niyogibacteria bacterium]|nr:phosphatase PAP2 family protein [Candidatus Niyogibacteria bacterium]